MPDSSFGPFAFDRQSRLLWRDGTEIAAAAARPRRPRAADRPAGPGRRAAGPARRRLEGRLRHRHVARRGRQLPAAGARRRPAGAALHPDRPPPRLPLPPPPTDRAGVRPRRRRRPGSDPGRREALDRGRRVRMGCRGQGVQSRLAEADWSWCRGSLAVLCAALAIARGLAHRERRRRPRRRRSRASRSSRRRDGVRSPTRRRSPSPPTAASSPGPPAKRPAGRCALYVRPIDRLDAQRACRHRGGHAPFFSPDGRWIGFFADGKLKKIAASGGAPSIARRRARARRRGVGRRTDGSPSPAHPPAGCRWSAIRADPSPADPAARGDRGECGTRSGVDHQRHRPERTRLHRRDQPDRPDRGPRRPGARRCRSAAATRRYSSRGPGRRRLPAAGRRPGSAGGDLRRSRALVLTGRQRLGGSTPAAGDRPQFAAGAEALAVVSAAGTPQRVWTDGADAASL